MATASTHLVKIDTRIDEVLDQMAQLDAGQIVKIRGREVTRVDLERRLDSLISAREKLGPAAARDVRSPYRLASLQRARRSG